MNAPQRANRDRRTDARHALLAVLTLVNGCASEQHRGAPPDEGTDAVASAAHEIRYTCSLAGTTLGTLRVFPVSAPAHATCSTTGVELPDALRDFCRTPPHVPPVCPDCNDLRNYLDCYTVP
jgi:hypothetical protein